MYLFFVRIRGYKRWIYIAGGRVLGRRLWYVEVGCDGVVYIYLFRREEVFWSSF